MKQKKGTIRYHIWQKVNRGPSYQTIWMSYRISPTNEELETFSSQTENGIHLFHEGGGTYRIDKSNGTVRTKYVKFIESEFLGSIADSDFESDYDTTGSFQNTNTQDLRNTQCIYLRKHPACSEVVECKVSVIPKPDCFIDKKSGTVIHAKPSASSISN